MSVVTNPLNVDFTSLAIKDADFAEIFTESEGRIDFHNPRHLQQLTKTILKVNFNLGIELPDNRLCPPIPVRYEYIQWLSSLLGTSRPASTTSIDAERQIMGIDIGVGASCIYPLIGCAAYSDWNFRGVEIDDTNFNYANKNVQINGLEERIKICRNDTDSPLINLLGLRLDSADFVMCNPPFFSSKEDMVATFGNKKKPPPAVCTGAEVEMIAEGGDLGFVMRIFEESEKLRTKVQWYSSMLGKLSSTNALVAVLKEKNINNYAITCLQAGNITKRWVVAWSFGGLRPEEAVARRNVVAKTLLPPSSTYSLPLSTNLSASEIKIDIDAVFKNLAVDWLWDGQSDAGLFFAGQDVWSRSARRRMARSKLEALDKGVSAPAPVCDGKVALGVRISFMSKGHGVEIRWLQGLDGVLFESFCGMLKRKLVLEKPA